MRLRVFALLFLVLHSPLFTLHSAFADSTATGGLTNTATCNSTTVPVKIVDTVDHGVWVANDRASSVWIWVVEVDDATKVTTRAGVPIAPGNANLFSPATGWHGNLWCLTDTTGTATARWNKR